ncbi:MAG TPA: head GIN domain-containing protein [Acidimicrobiia bacterium]|nr:head GIN domain-containing protein [Acidimicrobiia bacterium]
MKLKTAVSLVLLAAVVSACTAIRGSGDVVTIEIPIDDFSRLAVSHSFEVNVTVGEEPSLTLRVDDNIESSLDVGVTGDTLRIGLEPRTTVSNATLEADLTVASLDAIEGSGAVNVHLTNLEGSTLELQLSGASDVDGAVDFDSMMGEISGASNLSVSGRTATLDIEASGASDLSLLDLEVGALIVSLSGASSAEVNVTDSIEASVSGASSLRYRGDPDVTSFDVSGASSIDQINSAG